MIKVGRFELEVYGSGYPVQCTLRLQHWSGDYGYDLSFNHTELSDLMYAVQKAMRQAEAALPDDRKGEVRV